MVYEILCPRHGSTKSYGNYFKSVMRGMFKTWAILLLEWVIDREGVVYDVCIVPVPFWKRDS